MSRQPEGLECLGMQQHLEAWLDGELAPADAAALGRHLESCRACRRELQKAERVSQALRRLPERDAPPRVLAAVRERAERGPWYRDLVSRSGLVGPLPATLAAIALLLISVAVFTARTGPGSTAVEEQALAEATEEARFALVYLGRIGRQTGLLVRDEHLERRVLSPLAKGLGKAGALGPGMTEDDETTDR